MPSPKGTHPPGSQRQQDSLSLAARCHLAGNLNSLRLSNPRNVLEKYRYERDLATRAAIEGQVQTTLLAYWDECYGAQDDPEVGALRQRMKPFLASLPLPRGAVVYIPILSMQEQRMRGRCEKGMRIMIMTPQGEMLLRETTIICWR